MSNVGSRRRDEHTEAEVRHGGEAAVTIGWDAYRSEVSSLLDAIGRTPLVRLQRVAPDGAELLAKVEWYGPTGSVKDRIYAAMLTKAEERGDLRPGMTIIECTTGNAGIACSAVAAIKGYDCLIVMPEGMSDERKRMIAAYGATLELTPGAGTDIDLALARMHEIVATDPERYFFPGEFENPDNPIAQLASGEEIWEQCDGRIDAVIGSQGTGGWISGVARALKARDPSILAFAVEPSECPLISEQRWGTHGVPGIGDGIIPPNLDLGLMDGIVTASTDEALETARRLAREEGLLCGPSSGINVAAAHKVAAKHPDLRRLVTVICDTGQRYLSGELFGDKPPADEPYRPHDIDPAILAQLDANRDRLEFIS
jgi:cysteine synthase